MALGICFDVHKAAKLGYLFLDESKPDEYDNVSKLRHCELTCLFFTGKINTVREFFEDLLCLRHDWLVIAIDCLLLMILFNYFYLFN